MNRCFCRRQREDQPSLAGVHGCQSEDVPEEETISRRILAVDDDMRSKDHDLCPFFAPVILPQASRFSRHCATDGAALCAAPDRDSD
jgi:hypothetical protein